MDIPALSMKMSQYKVQESTGIAVMKIVRVAGKENADQMTEMM